MATSTSFTKKVKANFRQIPGAKPSIYNSQLLVSTGVPSLDAVLGGGVAVGTVVLIEEDAGGKYAEVLTRYFLAEGVVSDHALSVISANEDPQRMLQRLPAPVDNVGTNSSEHRPASQGSGGDADSKMAIAWRYQHQHKAQPKAQSTFGHYYNLSQTMDAQRLQSADVDCVSFSHLLAYENENLDRLRSPYCRYHCALQRIRKRIEEGSFATSAQSSKRNILRIAIHGLGSTLWGETCGSGDDGGDKDDASLLQFLLALRATLRTSFSVCLLTMPTYLFQNTALVKRVQRLCDTVLRLHSFSASLKTKNPALRDYSGLLHLVKFPCLNELVPHMPETLDLAFRCRRKKFTVEVVNRISKFGDVMGRKEKKIPAKKLHLPPELSDTASREQDIGQSSLAPSMACSSSTAGSSLLDF